MNSCHQYSELVITSCVAQEPFCCWLPSCSHGWPLRSGSVTFHARLTSAHWQDKWCWDLKLHSSVDRIRFEEGLVPRQGKSYWTMRPVIFSTTHVNVVQNAASQIPGMTNQAVTQKYWKAARTIINERADNTVNTGTHRTGLVVSS